MQPPPDHGDEVPTVLQAKGEPSKPAADFRLVVEAGPDVGASLALDGSQPSRVLIGTSPVCDVRLTDREVSRRHAALEPLGDELRVTDLGSSNGTFVERVRIAEAYLKGGETVSVGASRLRVTRAQTEPKALPTAMAFGRLVGGSRVMRRLYPLCERLAKAVVPVIIEGETGTGKEVLAEALHERGPRAAGPFVVFDCTAVPSSLVESELFGHERGAFTGATSLRKGVFEQAHGGTLLIDEIGDLDPALQPKLLRALERSEVRRVGGNQWLRVDVRVLSATRRDLDKEVQVGRFRDDLYHRLAVGRVELPPLRERHGDVPMLVSFFCAQLGGSESSIPAEVLARWVEAPWPGNVRELRNAVARQLALGELPEQLEDADPPRATSTSDLFESVLSEGLPLIQARQKIVEAFERLYLERALAAHGGSVVRAAAGSGIARRYFQILRAKRG